MYRHFETDVISAVILAVVLMDAKKKLDGTTCRDRMFLLCLRAGILAACFDVVSSLPGSTASPTLLALWQTIRCAGFPLLVCCWMGYAISIFLEDAPRARALGLWGTLGGYAVYVAFLAFIPFGGEGNGARAALFLPTAFSGVVSLALYALVFALRKKITEKKTVACLLALPLALAVGRVAERLLPGCLMVLPCYMIVLFIAYSLLQNQNSRRIIRRLENAADVDPLTGLLNRAAAERRIRECLAKGDAGCCAMIIADMDDLKKVNDTLGHPCGDEALQLIAKAFQAHFRRLDVVGRLGGDEFIIFLSQISDEKALSDIIENVLRRFGSLTVGDGTRLPVRCSFGAAAAHGDDASYSSLYANADKALYKAKRGGKYSYAINTEPIEG